MSKDFPALAQPTQNAVDRIRLGIILPSVNTVAEPWMHRMSPQGVTIQTARMFLPDQFDSEILTRMDRQERTRAVMQLVSCRASAIGYGCASSSLLQGPTYDKELRHEMERESGRPCATVMGAVVDAFRSRSINRIALLSPYASSIAIAESSFLKAAGFNVVAEHHMGIQNAFDLASPTADTILDLTLKMNSAKLDGFLLSCMNFVGHEVIEKIEKSTGKMVVTSTQALLWRLLFLLGNRWRSAHMGKLFD